MADNKITYVITEEDLWLWLEFCEHPETWDEIPWLRRKLAVAMAKHGRSTIRRLAAISAVALLTFWATYHLAGGPVEPGFDLIVGAILAILIILFLFNT